MSDKASHLSGNTIRLIQLTHQIFANFFIIDLIKISPDFQKFIIGTIVVLTKLPGSS